MRIPRDESLPRDLALLMVGHDAVTVQAAGWSSVSDGKLLALAAFPIAVIVLRARNNRIQTLRPLLPEVLQLLNNVAPRTLRNVGA